MVCNPIPDRDGKQEARRMEESGDVEFPVDNVTGCRGQRHGGIIGIGL